MREVAIRETYMSDSAGRFGYTMQVLPYPSPQKQSYRAHYARVRNSRDLHGGKRCPIWVSSAGTSLSATRKATLRSPLCASSQIARPAWRKALADLGIQCTYSIIRHPQSNATERVMREPAIRDSCMAESAARFGYPVQVLNYQQTAEKSYRAIYARARNSRALHGVERCPIWVSSEHIPLSVTRKKSYRARYVRTRHSRALHFG
jgi:hypothetical protein